MKQNIILTLVFGVLLAACTNQTVIPTSTPSPSPTLTPTITPSPEVETPKYEKYSGPVYTYEEFAAFLEYHGYPIIKYYGAYNPETDDYSGTGFIDGDAYLIDDTLIYLLDNPRWPFEQYPCYVNGDEVTLCETYVEKDAICSRCLINLKDNFLCYGNILLDLDGDQQLLELLQSDGINKDIEITYSYEFGDNVVVKTIDEFINYLNTNQHLEVTSMKDIDPTFIGITKASNITFSNGSSVEIYQIYEDPDNIGTPSSGQMMISQDLQSASLTYLDGSRTTLQAEDIIVVANLMLKVHSDKDGIIEKAFRTMNYQKADEILVIE